MKRQQGEGERQSAPVAPRAGAWIEAFVGVACLALAQSLPVRERGLKRDVAQNIIYHAAVAPRAGAWIEAPGVKANRMKSLVAPRAGAWIEA